MQVAEGSIKQGDGWVSQLAVLPAVVKPQEVLGMMLLLTAPQHTVTFDSDPDTVDGMSTHEIFIFSEVILSGLSSQA